MTNRRYRQTKRAASSEATRARIVTAVMALHEELGPRNTTIRAIAERAGVQRLTVYRHFASDDELFEACTSRWLELNPPPTPQAWPPASDGRAHCRAALAALYRYYRDTRAMWAASHRDEAEVPALQGPMAGFRRYLAGLAEHLAVTLPDGVGGCPGVTETLAHAVEFPTWASLADRGLSEGAAADLVMEWLDGVASAGGGAVPARGAGAG